jgi:hypothetical protein
MRRVRGFKAAGSRRKETAMDRLIQMDREQFIDAVLPEVRRIVGEVADAVNAAPDGKLINASEEKVRDLMSQLRQLTYERAVQMRIDSTESSFSPSGRHFGQADGEERPRCPHGSDG